MAGQQTITMVIAGDAAKLVKSLKTAGNETTVLGRTIKNFSVGAALAFAAVGTAAIGFSADAIKAASNLAETTNKADVVFGKSSENVKAFAKTTADALGQTQTQFLEASSTFGIFGKSAGLTGDANVKFSKTLATLASDLASFNNTTVDEAITALGAGLRGESEPLRRYGVLLDDATLKAQAFADGIYKGKGVLTPQQRVLAAYGVILKQTTVQQGDFNRTQDGFANASRRISALWGELQITVGQQLLPILIDVLPQIVDQLKQLTIDPEFNASIGGIATSIGDLLPQIMDFTKNALPNLVSGLTTIAGFFGFFNDFTKFNQGWTSAGANWLESLRPQNRAIAGLKAPGTSTTVNINVNSVSSSAETGRAIANALSTYYRTGGRQVK